MFTDIFSSFDPNILILSETSPIKLAWLLTALILLPTSPTLWMSPTSTFWLTTLPLTLISHQLARSSSRRILGWNTIVSSLFLFLIYINLSGLIPYVFSASSHLIFTTPFGITLWFSMILSSFTNNPKKFLALLLPGGAPSWLNPFLVTIESSSTTARPGTLSFRLAANMSAGHIVIALLAAYTIQSFFNSLPLLFLLLMLLAGYLLFEVGICMIQAFIFCLLLSLYSNEHS